MTTAIIPRATVAVARRWRCRAAALSGSANISAAPPLASPTCNVRLSSRTSPFSTAAPSSGGDDNSSNDDIDDSAAASESGSSTGRHGHGHGHNHAPRRVWRSSSSAEGETRVPTCWDSSVDEDRPASELRAILDRIGDQERQSGRMRQSHLGVVRVDPGEDMRLLIENFTVPALASALRDREDTLQQCASLLSRGQLKELADTLRPFESKYVAMRRRRENTLDLRTNGFDDTATLEILRKGLGRMPRRVSMAHQRRAGVVLPLCNVHGVPCILFEKRSRHLRAHPDEVCLPGGMVSTADDKSIVGTCLREMEEEIDGLPSGAITVLGVLRCNWGEVHHLTGVAVTPVVCFVGEIGDLELRPNPDEVAEVFTVPLASFLNRESWVHREDFAPIFTGGPHVIWGLTGYIVNRFVKDVLARYNIDLPEER